MACHLPPRSSYRTKHKKIEHFLYLNTFKRIQRFFWVEWDINRSFLLKVNNRNSRKRCEICSKLTIKIPERRQWRRSGVFIVNFEHISHLVLVFLW